MYPSTRLGLLRSGFQLRPWLSASGTGALGGPLLLASRRDLVPCLPFSVCVISPSQPEAAAAQLHTMFVHWRRSPLPLALLPPPSITPRTASMPRSSFRTARLRVSFVLRLSTPKPSSPASRARLRSSRVRLAVASTSSASLRVRLTRL